MNPAATLFAAFGWSLPDASRAASRVDHLFFVLTAASGALVVLLVALNLTFLIRYRRGSPAPRPRLRLAAWKIETGWITGTLAAFLFFFFWGAWVYLDMERPPAGAYSLAVTARQWMWDVRHPNGRREFNQLHVPLGQPIELVMSSEDVIHSLFVPAFRLKQDVVPGKTVRSWFEATKPGVYHLFCTQYCGTAHAQMTGEVIAMTPEAYAAWLETGNPGGDLAARGRALFTRYGCSGCHAGSSTVHAPPLEGIYRRHVALADGTFRLADEAYLRDSILLPQKDIVAGYAPVMPSFKGVIPEAELLDLLSYLKTLGAPNHELPARTPPASTSPLPPPPRP